MKTLDDIKQEYARENNFCEWSEILYSIDDPAEIDEHFDKVAKLYALEACRESLSNSANNLSSLMPDSNLRKPIYRELVLDETNIPQEVKL